MERELNDLARLGDELEGAVAAAIARNEALAHRHGVAEPTTLQEDPMTDDLTPRRARRSRRALVIGGIAAIAIAGGAAATAISLSGDDVSHGMPGSSAVFIDTEPSCTTTDGVVFDCTLAHAPTAEVLSDYLGAGETFNDAQGRIAGGCRGTSSDGLKWTCFAGQRAVDEGIIGQDFLGEQTYGPGRG